MIYVATIDKRVAWVRTYEWDFSRFAEVIAGNTLTSPTVSVTGPDTALTASAASVVGAKVLSTLAGGNTGLVYTLECLVYTSGGATLQQQGLLNVVD